MPDPQHQRRKQFAILITVLLVPLAIALWDPQVAVLAFLLGLFIAMRAIRFLRTQAVDSLLDDPAHQRLQHLQGERGRTVWVSLLDDAGQPLSETAAQQKLAQAKSAAGPRDMVVGVKGKVDKA